MSVILIHLSDIHFGQEKGTLFYVHEDVRERLLDDVTVFAAAIAPKRISGVMVTGDIAYSGTEEEYRQAGKWLDRLTAAIGCERSDVQVVPGNHDIDRSQISSAGSYLLKEVEEAGEAKLNVFLRDENDRELLHKRFHAYSEFSEAYNCPLDKNGGGAGDRLIELAPGRHIRIVGLNTALACSKNDVEGKLLLGERQRVLPRTSGEELVVLAHHPLKWMADAEETAQYVRSRARVLVTGHEHNPSARVEKVFEGADLLTIEAGATVPPWSDEDYTYTFNFIEFGWNETEDALAVSIHPRLPDDPFGLFAALLMVPIAIFTDWDRAKTARDGIVDAFVKSSWEPAELLRAAMDAGITSKVLGYLASTGSGRNYLRKIEQSVSSYPEPVRKQMITALRKFNS